MTTIIEIDGVKYDVAGFGKLTIGDRFHSEDHGVQIWTGENQSCNNHIILREIEKIPAGVVWDDELKSFWNDSGEFLYYGQFDYVKWSPRSGEFPKRSTKRMVPLGPEDIVPGTVLRHEAWSSWYWQDCRIESDGKGVCRFYFDNAKLISHYHPFSGLQSCGWSYKTPSMTDFARCEKQEK